MNMLLAIMLGTAYASDPWEDYAAGRYLEALAGFAGLRADDPADLAVRMNQAAAAYKAGKLDDAERTFTEVAASATDPGLKSRALYGLGNTTWASGRLEDAIKAFEGALDANPDDEDARFNLELARQELERRQQQAQDQQQQQQDGEQPPEDQPQDGEQEPQDGEQEPQDGEQEQQEGEQTPQDGEQQQEPSGAPQPGDQDGDGLSDEQEQAAQNPTDPTRADTDGDGLSDGEEDADGDGAVSAGETDPNDPDSDDDGVPDGVPMQATLPADAALRLIEALQERRPPPGPDAKVKPSGGKDW